MHIIEPQWSGNQIVARWNNKARVYRENGELITELEHISEKKGFFERNDIWDI
jgi:hypothetical protein